MPYVPNSTWTDGVGGTPVSAARLNNIESGLVALNPTAWTAVTFQNGWSNFGGGYQAAQYRKIGDVVQVRGLIKSGTVGSAAFTLPAGFRPVLDESRAVISNGVFGALYINAAGIVTPFVGSNVSFQVDAIFSTL